MFKQMYSVRYQLLANGKTYESCVTGSELTELCTHAVVVSAMAHTVYCKAGR